MTEDLGFKEIKKPESGREMLLAAGETKCACTGMCGEGCEQQKTKRLLKDES